MNLVPAGMTEQQMKEAQDGAQVLPVQTKVEEYTGPVFKTVIKNNRDTDAMLQTDSGGNWFLIPPGEEITLCSWSNRTMYAPFVKVSFEKKGKVSTTRRFNFKDPAEEAPRNILLDNRDGNEQEVIKINDNYVSVVRGIPRRVVVPLYDRLVVYKAIVWRKRVVKEPAPGRRDYLITREIVEKVLVPRRASDVRAIKRLLEKEAVDDARRMAAIKFGNVVGEDDTEPEVDDGTEMSGDQG